MSEGPAKRRFLTWREVAAAASVVASLVFLASEVRQNTIAIRAQSRQALASAVQDWLMSVATDEQLNALVLAANRGESFTSSDTLRVQHTLFALLRHHENVFLQIQEGAIDASGFQSYGWTGNPNYMSPFMHSYWPRIRHRFHPGFAAAIESEYGLPVVAQNP
jgi:hypothetical protein